MSLKNTVGRLFSDWFTELLLLKSVQLPPPSTFHDDKSIGAEYAPPAINAPNTATAERNVFADIIVNALSSR
tara:strand:- start:1164 stop:1379 length:216 start_codon:yes stop_codon:yes gene_type:complete